MPVAVPGGWAPRELRGEASAEAAFLRALRDAGCTYFGNVLGPDYNAAHRDHFHFGMRRFGLCR